MFNIIMKFLYSLDKKLQYKTFQLCIKMINMLNFDIFDKDINIISVLILFK